MKAAPRSKLGIFNSTPAPMAVVTQERGTGKGRPDREGRVMMPFWVPKTARTQLRVMAAHMDTTQQDLMAKALNEFFQKHGKPPIA